MRILAIDPANVKSGYAVVEMPKFKLIDFGKVDNAEIYEKIKEYGGESEVAIERIASFGMAVGESVFRTCEFIGRISEFTEHIWEKDARYILRKDEKMCLCGSMRAKDTNIRQALIDRYAKHDFKNGKGTKKEPDTFYGVSADAWSAIAVAVTYYEMESEKK